MFEITAVLSRNPVNKLSKYMSGKFASAPLVKDNDVKFQDEK